MIDNLDKLQKYVDLLKEDEFLYIEIIMIELPKKANVFQPLELSN